MEKSEANILASKVTDSLGKISSAISKNKVILIKEVETHNHLVELWQTSMEEHYDKCKFSIQEISKHNLKIQN